MANHNDNCTTLLAFSLGKLDSGQVFKRGSSRISVGEMGSEIGV